MEDVRATRVEVGSVIPETRGLSKGYRWATTVIAAHDADPVSKDNADLVCDGINDTAIIRQAIHDLADDFYESFHNGFQGGPCVVLTEGHFILTSPIFLQPQVSLIGQGNSTVLVRGTAGSHTFITMGFFSKSGTNIYGQPYFIKTFEGNECVISHLRFEAYDVATLAGEVVVPSPNFGSVCNGIITGVGSWEHVIVTHCQFKGITENCIDTFNAAYTTVEHCTFEDVGVGIRYSTVYSTARHNTFVRTKNEAIKCDGFGLAIDSNVFLDCNQSGRSDRAAIYAPFGYNLTLSNSVFRGCFGDVLIEGQTKESRNEAELIAINGNVFSDTVGTSILLTGFVFTTNISNNVFNGGNPYHIRFTGEQLDSLVTGNALMYQSDGTGAHVNAIRLDSATEYNAVIGNKIGHLGATDGVAPTGTSGAAVSVAGRNNIVALNDLRSSVWAATAIDDQGIFTEKFHPDDVTNGSNWFDRNRTIVPYGSGGWRYLQIARTDNTDYSAVNFNDSAWAVGSMSFGSSNFAGGVPTTTSWSLNTRLWMRKTVTLPATGSYKFLDFYTNDADIYWDGVLLRNGFEISDSDFRSGFDVKVPPYVNFTYELTAGSHLLAIRATDGPDGANDQAFYDLQLVMA